ncbi:hypothetical protein [Rhodoferax koreensis]|uniref:hypothetical protein n=1 Tax=Rhodoferax koreensis TaxID=1842727 RepID=UPI0012FF8B87|nr:hypothetical protein [Rhodoferax koreense]
MTVTPGGTFDHLEVVFATNPTQATFGISVDVGSTIVSGGIIADNAAIGVGRTVLTVPAGWHLNASGVPIRPHRLWVG